MGRVLLLIFMLFLIGLSSNVAAQNPTEEVDSPIEKMFIPNGYDINGEVEVILQGRFRNSCFQVGYTSYTIDHEARIVQIVAKSVQPNALLCALVMVPFLQVVKIPGLKLGSYKIVLKHDPSIYREIFLEERSLHNHPDVIYAPIDRIDLLVDNDESYFALTGTFPFTLVGCMKFRDIKTSFVEEQNILVVLPQVELTPYNDDPACETNRGGHSFTKIVPLDTPMTGDGLLHVRSMSGHALNHFISED